MGSEARLLSNWRQQLRHGVFVLCRPLHLVIGPSMIL